MPRYLATWTYTSTYSQEFIADDLDEAQQLAADVLGSLAGDLEDDHYNEDLVVTPVSDDTIQWTNIFEDGSHSSPYARRTLADFAARRSFTRLRVVRTHVLEHNRTTGAVRLHDVRGEA
jgi:hypothetical protein